MRTPVMIAALVLTLSSCSGYAGLPVSEGQGSNPQLPEAKVEKIPTVNIARAVGWKDGKMPVAAAGLQVGKFADGLKHPRWIYVLPNNDILVAESNGPERPKDAKGIKGFFMKLTMKNAGAGVESAERITLLRDADGDGIAETRSTFLENLHSPFGMALVGHDFYVANTDAVMRHPYKGGETKITAAGTKLADLPAGPINHHWTKSLIASKDGSKLYVGVGSNSNVAENGMDKEENRAAVLEIDRATGASRVYASGLRNPVGSSWNPVTGQLWVSVNERDELGSDLVPDYMTSVKDGGFYGWPYSYYGAHVDPRVKPQRPEMVAKAIVPDYALGAHTASLGLVFYDANLFPAHYHKGAFIGQHGSWNRKPRSGYKVVFVPFEQGKPAGMPEDVLTGFLDADGNAQGRPVGVQVDQKGALLVADDVGNAIWRVTPASGQSPAPAR